MNTLNNNEIMVVSGGEVGATGMGGDYAYTGERSFGECMKTEMGKVSFEDAYEGRGFGGALWTCLTKG